MQPTFNMEIEIDNIEALNLLLEQRKIQRFTFNFPWLSDTENEHWQRLLSKYYYACGCETGTFFLLSSIIAVAVYFTLKQTADSYYPITLGKVLWALLFICTTSGIGKAAGLAFAKYRFKKTFIALRDSLPG
ncbi:hypothetical protein BH09BAC6_BH09BAC6_21680 [soil metagenome]|jgi:hypothetical protein